MSLARQIFEAHRAGAAPGRAAPEGAALEPDQLLIGPGATAFVLRLADALLRGAPPSVKAIAWWERSLLAPAPGDDEGRELLECAARLGVPLLAPVAGACEPVFREALAAPGRLIATCAMEAAACGALGAVCWRVSPLEAAALLCGASVAPSEPAVARLVLVGGLAPGVGGVDAALEFARRTDLRRWEGCGIEVSGGGTAALGMGDRIALARTLADCGAAFVLLPCDEVTRETLRAWGRDADWRELRTADAPDAPDEAGSLASELDLDALEPLVAPAADAALARPLRHALEHPLRAVSLGPYADEDDIAAWRARLTARSVAAGLDVTLVPGTPALASALAASGDRDVLLARGVDVREPLAAADATRDVGGTRLGCGQPRRSPLHSGWWLANAEVCAASALAGALADPREQGVSPGRPARRTRTADTRPTLPGPLALDLAEMPSANYARVAAPPVGSLRAIVWLAIGDDWPAERIVSRSARARRALLDDPVAGLFPGVDRAWTRQVAAEARGAIVAGRNFGGGDVADEAAWALRRAGVAVVLARSFAVEAARALTHAGILALEPGRRPLHEIAAPGDELEIPSLPEAVEPGHPVGVRNLTSGIQDTLHHGLDSGLVAVWRAGGLLSLAVAEAT
jgi:aconitate hydratase